LDAGRRETSIIPGKDCAMEKDTASLRLELGNRKQKGKGREDSSGGTRRGRKGRNKICSGENAGRDKSKKTAVVFQNKGPVGGGGQQREGERRRKKKKTKKRGAHKSRAGEKKGKKQ